MNIRIAKETAKRIHHLSLKKILGGLIATALSSGSQSAVLCTIDKVTPWNNTYQVDVSVTNTGTTTLNAWTVTLKFAEPANLNASRWNANLSGTTLVTATNVSYNGTLTPGSKTTFGFQGGHDGSFIPPTCINQTQNSSSSKAASSAASSVKTSSSIGTTGGFKGSINLPARVQAEHYAVARNETTPNNLGNPSQCTYYGLGVDVNNLSTGGCYVGWNDPNEALEYQLGIGGNNMDIILKASSASAGKRIRVLANGVEIGTVTTSGKGWNNWELLTLRNKNITNNTRLRVEFIDGYADLDYMEFTKNIPATTLKAAADFPIGTAVSIWNANSIFTSTRDQALINREMNALVAENIMKPPYLHPELNRFYFTDADKLVEFAKKNNLQLHGHTLIWHAGAPAYFDALKNNPNGMKGVLKTHVDTIAKHFAGKVVSWDVVNEALDPWASGVNGYRNSVFFQAMGRSYIFEAFKNARLADPTADLYYNDYSIEDGGSKYQTMLAMIDEMKAQNIPIDGIGFQMHVGIDSPSIASLESSLQGIVNRGLKVRMSELDITFNNHFDKQPALYKTFTQEMANKQHERYRQIVLAYRKIVPSCLRGGITVWNLTDQFSWLNNIIEEPTTIKDPDWPVLFDANYQAKPAYYGFLDGLKNTSVINNNEKYCQ